ncbi:MAG: serine/threonine protein kinase [Deltaproteobacteria bacterium]|nr:MAG: serine/threonine protein kinase [Deltaproteobacteria bacterium]
MTFSDPQHSTYERRFQFIREIAQGGFGTVFLVRLLQPDGFTRVVAVKLLHPEWCENDEVASRMRDEARLLGLLRHRNIVQVIDLTKIDGRVAVVMEYVEAVDVKALLSQIGEPVPLGVALDLIAQAASALDVAYNKAPLEGDRPLRVVHRDIKPSNLMLDAEGVVKVLDFGVARADFAEREAETRGMTFGSYDYMPSERRFMEAGGETSDVYSLGAVLFELVMGARLGKGLLDERKHAQWVARRVDELHSSLQAKGPDLEELCQVLTAMLAFHPEDRPRPAEIATTLRRLSRRVGGLSIEDWASRSVPPVLQAARAREPDHLEHPLIGKTVLEDRVLQTGSDEALWKPSPIPKRVRDAAPSRPPVAGTVTPAPLRKRPTSTTPGQSAPLRAHTAPQEGSVAGWGSMHQTNPASVPRVVSRRPSMFSRVALAVLWALAIVVSGFGLMAVALAIFARLAS